FQSKDSNRQDALTLEQLEEWFREELKDAETWYAELREREIGWIRDGKDPEAEFGRLYAEEPGTVTPEPDSGPRRSELVRVYSDWKRPISAAGGILAVVGVAAGALLFLRRRNRQRRPAKGRGE